MSQDDAVRNMVQNDGSKNANKTQYFSFKTFIELKWYLCDKKKSVWQVTTIIQPALCHLVTSHFQEIACNWTPKDQIRWPIFLMLLCMIVLTEKTLKFPQPIIFWSLVFFMSQDDAHYQNHRNAPLVGSGSSGAIWWEWYWWLRCNLHLHITAFAGFSRSYISMLPLLAPGLLFLWLHQGCHWYLTAPTKNATSKSLLQASMNRVGRKQLLQNL